MVAENNELKAYYDRDALNQLLITAAGDEFNHIGIYEDPNDIRSGGLKATEDMLSGIILNPAMKVLDIGSGYGGTARYIAKNFGATVHCLNVSVLQNDISREKNKQQRLDTLIEVHDGDFVRLPFQETSYDVVIAQESIVHALDKPAIFKEVHRVLKNQGVFVVTDALWRDSSSEVNEFVQQRYWGLYRIATIKNYLDYADQVGMHLLRYRDWSSNLVTGYADDIRACQEELTRADAKASCAAIEEELKIFQNRYDAAVNGYLCLSFFQFRQHANKDS